MQGRTVMPGLIDAHSHFPSNGLVSVGLDLSSPPIGDIANTEQLLQAISKAARQQSSSRWLIGFNYDDASLAEGKHPTRQQLDKAAPDHAVYLWHRSGHMGVANSRALQELGHVLQAGQPNAIGYARNLSSKQYAGAAHVGRDADGQLTGLLQEHAAPGLRRLLQEIPFWQLPSVLLAARDDYLRAGITTVQNGYADTTVMHLLRWAQRLGIVKQRLVFWVSHDKLAKPIESPMALGSGAVASVTEHDSASLTLATSIGWKDAMSESFTLAAIKLNADGSPQGRTAWLSVPYLPDPALPEGYSGLRTPDEAALHRTISQYHKAGFQLAIHGNGDAAIDSIIQAVLLAQTQFPRNNTRHLLVHAQTIRADQLEQLAQLDMSVSFFPTHTFYWGDWYRHRVLGEERAAGISPLASADKAGVRYSLHTDSPVTPMQPMQMLWSATERKTKSGFVLGREQIISRERALRAMTIDAAWQNHLEDSRGSLEVGKLADWVVLSDNPLTVDDPRTISVEEVYIDGIKQRR